MRYVSIINLFFKKMGRLIEGDSQRPLCTEMGFSRSSKRPLIFAVVFVLIGLVLLIVGIVLLSLSKKDCQRKDASSPVYSEEAKSSGLVEFLKKVQDTYYELHPQDLIYKPPNGVPLEELKVKFKPYDPSPSALKRVTDTARRLLAQLEELPTNKRLLKRREKKAMAQLKHYLANDFGTPYDGDYYAGDFLMGPNLFCWQPICSMGIDLHRNLMHFQPKSLTDVDLLHDKMKLVRGTFRQYVENLRYGVKAGMTRSVEECLAGINSFKRKYLNVALNGAFGIYEEPYMAPILAPGFFSILKPEQLTEWKEKMGKSVNESIREYALKYVGKPIEEVLSYLKTEHLQHCVPSNVSSGLASLPLSYIFVNGSRTFNKTTKTLPSGEPLNGKKAYSSIMPYFTTVDKSPEDVHRLGFEMLHKLYPEVIEIARAVTNQINNDTARDQFIQRLNESDMYFLKEPIPRNESDENAFKLCSSDTGAQKYCPKRWEAIQNWFKEARMVMSLLDPQTNEMFYFTGPKHTTPNCPVEMAPNFNPSSAAQSYTPSDKACSRNAYYNIPFFLDRPGPKYEEWSVNAHEARPGHHTQVQGMVEHFRGKYGDVISWLDASNKYTAFSEGWALYAENPLIARDTNVYKKEPFQKYGMLKWQVWRALRLIVDTGLHYKGFTRDQALDYFAKYAWDTSDSAQKEVTRYQSDPGQATAYMIGQLKIIELRNYAKEKLGEKFNLKDFHFYLLSQGSAPLRFLQESIEEYVYCSLDNDGEGCHDVLNPVVASKEDDAVSDVQATGDDAYIFAEKPSLEHYM